MGYAFHLGIWEKCLSIAVPFVTIKELLVLSNKNCLVIGGGVAGMATSLGIANSGNHVYIVEREDKLGGKTYWLDKLNPTHELAEGCDGDISKCETIPKIEDINSNDNIEVLLGTKVIGVDGEAPDFKVQLAGDNGQMELNVGAIVVATGTKNFDPTEIKEYWYGEYEDIITSKELLDLLKENSGELKRPSDGKVPSTVNFVQCVGSRDRHKGHPYCSVICCTFSVSLSRRIKEMHPDMDVYVHYIDLRGPYHGFEDLLTMAQDRGVLFVRGRVGDIVPEGDKLLVRTEEIDTGDLFFIESDMVILAVGQELDESDKEMAEMLGIPFEEHEFMKGMECLGEDGKNGVFVVGSARGPRGVIHSIEDAKSVSFEIIDFLNSD